MLGGEGWWMRFVELLDSYAVGIVERRHVRDDHAVADVQAVLDLDRIDRRASEADGDARRFALVGNDLEDPDRAVRLAEARPRDVHDVVEALELDRAVDGEIG